MANPASPLPFAERTLGDIVKNDPRAAAVLERFGLDYCCGGGRTLGAAAAARKLELSQAVEALEALGTPVSDERARDQWNDLDALTEHIVQRHHRYVREMTPSIQTWLARLVARHGGRHPELIQVRDTFDRLTYELATHMTKEENILFPAIDELAAARRAGDRLPASPFGTVLNPVRVKGGASAQSWKWSSYRATQKLGHAKLTGKIDEWAKNPPPTMKFSELCSLKKKKLAEA